MNRRRFLKYAGTTAAVVGASALGIDYLLRPNPFTQNQNSTSSHTITSNASSTELTSSATSSYQRQFPNIAHNDNIVLGAHYMPFFESGTWNRYWNPSNGTPLLGQYDSGDSLTEEPRTIEKMKAFARENGYSFRGKDHEIYFGDPRRTKPERLKTVLRQPIQKVT